MKTMVLKLMLLSPGVLLSAAALAQEGRGAREPLRLTHLIGAMVTDSQSRALGVVNDILIDRNGKEGALVIAIAGSRGLGDKIIAVRPDAAVSIAPRERALRSAPGGIAQPGTLRVSTHLTQKDLAAAPDFESASPTSAGTPEGVSSQPKSSTESGGPG